MQPDLEQEIDAGNDELAEVAKQAPGTKIAPAHGIAAIALNMALKYHNINTVQDGVLYQQYKMEGRNMRELHLDMVFETAIRMEQYMLGASQRIASIVMEALVDGVEDAKKSENNPPTEGGGEKR